MDLLLGLLGLLGVALSMVFGLWCLIIAFRTSVIWGLAYMFIPFAGLVFVVCHWDQVGKPFLGLFCSVAVVVFVSLTLPAAMGGLPHLGGRNWESSALATESNMRGVQVAAEAYASVHEGMYPPNIELFKCNFPEGRPPSVDGKAPINPISREAEWPLTGTVTDVAAARKTPPGPLKAGAVEYSVVYDAGHKAIGYAVRGGDADGQALPNHQDKASTLVLSNQ